MELKTYRVRTLVTLPPAAAGQQPLSTEVETLIPAPDVDLAGLMSRTRYARIAREDGIPMKIETLSIEEA